MEVWSKTWRPTPLLPCPPTEQCLVDCDQETKKRRSEMTEWTKWINTAWCYYCKPVIWFFIGLSDASLGDRLFPENRQEKQPSKCLNMQQQQKFPIFQIAQSHVLRPSFAWAVQKTVIITMSRTLKNSKYVPLQRHVLKQKHMTATTIQLVWRWHQKENLINI